MASKLKLAYDVTCLLLLVIVLSFVVIVYNFQRNRKFIDNLETQPTSYEDEINPGTTTEHNIEHRVYNKSVKSIVSVYSTFESYGMDNKDKFVRSTGFFEDEP